MSLCVVLLTLGISHKYYFQRTWLIDSLIEPAVVVFGYPLYQQLRMIGRYWWQLCLVCSLCVFFSLSVSAVLAKAIGLEIWVIKSLVVLSTTTAIAMETSEVMQGSASLASVMVTFGGLSGAAFGLTVLTFVKVTDERARGMAIGAFSHAIGTATIAKDSYHSVAYSSVCLILCASLTALFAPIYIPFLLQLY